MTILISKKELLTRGHQHELTPHEARLIKTGVLDVSLLKDALLDVPQGLADCEVVSVELLAMVWNQQTERAEPVFNTRTSRGEHIGAYFAGAFRELRR